MSLNTPVLNNAVDTVVSEKRPTENYVNDTVLRLREDTGIRKRALIAFTRPFQQGATVFDANLSLYVKDGWAANTGRQLLVEPIAFSWRAGRVDWNAQDDPGFVLATNTVLVPVAGAYADGDVITVPVGPSLQAVADGTSWFGWRVSITGAVQNAALFLYSGNAVRRKPKLAVSWGNPPDPPSDLRPSQGRAITTDSPLLRFRFTDPDASSSQTALQVQADPDPFTTWAAPAYDSGVKITVEPSWDIADDPAWAASAARPPLNGTATWRVRVKDASIWSDWSDPATFGYQLGPGVVTLLSPAAAVVNDSTPPILWSTDFPQTGYRVLVYEGSAPAALVAVALDTDGVPYLTSGAGTTGADVLYDTDGRPYVPAAGTDVGLDTDSVPYVI